MLPGVPQAFVCALFILFHLCSTFPLLSYGGVLPSPPSLDHPGGSSISSSSSAGAGVMMQMSWLWGLLWGDDSQVAVLDHTPELTFPARPAAFGPVVDVLGYLLRVEDFSAPCGGGGGSSGGGSDGVDPPAPPPWLPHGGAYEVGDPDGEEAAWDRREARRGCPRRCMRWPASDKPQASEKWIALVMRGGCPFVDKVRQAQAFGAKGVVVGGETFEQDHHGDGLVQMYSVGDASNITIPSTYITHSSYLTLSSLIASSNTTAWGLPTLSVGITSDSSGWEWYSPLITFLLLLFLPSCLTLITLLIHRIRAARAAQRDRAPEDVVLNLPWCVWEGQQSLWELEKKLDVTQNVNLGQAGTGAVASGAAEDDASAEHPEPSTSQTHIATDAAGVLVDPDELKKWYDTQVECVICLEDFVKGDKVRVLPCRHVFHMDEVDDWLIHRRKLCPICKHDVTRPLVQPSRRQSLLSLSLDPLSESQQDSSSSSADTTPPGVAVPTERTPLLQ